MEVSTEVIEIQTESPKVHSEIINDFENKDDLLSCEKYNEGQNQNVNEIYDEGSEKQSKNEKNNFESYTEYGSKDEKELTEKERAIKKRWEEIKNCSIENVEITEKFYKESSSILYVPTSVECHGIEEIQNAHSYKRQYEISTKDLSDEVVVNTTICGNMIIEEKILTLLHNIPIKWILPGVKATGRRLVIPIVTIVTFDDDLYIKTKRVYWDQACVLKQVGLMPSISKCPYNGEDTDLPVKGVQQSNPLLSKKQLEDINTMDILNRTELNEKSIKRFKNLKSDYVNKNKNDNIKKLFEDDGLGVDERSLYDGRRRSYNTLDFKNKSDTLSGFISGDIKEEYSMNERVSNKSIIKNRNESKNIDGILYDNVLADDVSNQDSNRNSSISSMSSKTRKLFKEHLYQNDNIFSSSCKTTDDLAFSGKRIFANRNRDDVKISMDKSNSECEFIDSCSTIYDLDDCSIKKWDTNSLSRQTYSRDETLNESNYDNQEDLINEKMKNLCLHNNYMSEDSNVSYQDLNDNNSKEESNKRKHRIHPYINSSINFDYNGNTNVNCQKHRYGRKMVKPCYQSTFKIAYDKEELEQDYIRSRKHISPTYISHIFDKDNNDDTVKRKVRPIYKNSAFYESYKFDDAPEKKEIKPPIVIKDKYISNIFSDDVQEVHRHHIKFNPDIKNQITYSNIHFNGSDDEEEEEKKKSVSKRFSNNFSKKRYESNIFNWLNQTNSNDLANRPDVCGSINSSINQLSSKGKKTKYHKVDHVQEMFDTSSKGKINFRDIQIINSIHNSMHQLKAQRV